jgi:hypothetical protein
LQNNLNIHLQLRRKLGSETGGFQTLTIKRPKKKVPEWVNSHVKIRELLLRTFPLMKTNLKQREKAGRWARIIYLYYRRQWTMGQIAAELGIDYEDVKGILRSVTRVAQGRRANGTGKLKKTCPR